MRLQESERESAAPISGDHREEAIPTEALCLFFGAMVARLRQPPSESVMLQLKREMARSAGELGVYWPNSPCDVEKDSLRQMSKNADYAPAESSDPCSQARVLLGNPQS